MTTLEDDDFVSFDPEQPFWDRFYMVAPLVVVGTRTESGDGYDMAPKHMATPMGWTNYFGFVCTPRHQTYRNAVGTGIFTVSFPRPSQVVLASLAASPRSKDSDGPGTERKLEGLPTVPAAEVDALFLKDAYLFLECRLARTVDALGENSLLIGTIVAVHVHEDALRESDADEDAAIRENSLLAYLPPDRYATIDETNAFPFPAGFQK